MRETNHGVRIGVITVIISAIVEGYYIFFNPPLGPKVSVEGFAEAKTMELFFYVGTPIFVFVVVFLAYAAMTFRRRAGEDDDDAETAPVSSQSNGRAVFYWSLISISTVLFLAGWGIFTLNDVNAAPQAPKAFVVQVIAQQWHFTYRYPEYGGVETLDLAVPAGRAVTFNITSLDVVHDFWIYDVDVKQDAVPGQTTHAFMLAPKTGTHWITCDELCGLWHGFMRGPMYVLSDSDFAAWIGKEQRIYKALNGKLPTVNGVYYPNTPLAYPPSPQNSAQ